MSLAAIILAAGQGTRMNSDLPKVLHPLAGVPMLAHAMAAVEADRIVVVVGHGAEAVTKTVATIDENAVTVLQEEQQGTGHAVRIAEGELANFEGDVIVLYGDTPFISSKTIERMQAEREAGAAVVVLGFEADNPGGYGRLVLDENGLNAIVEAKDARPAELDITLCNSGVVMANRRVLFELLASVGNGNAKGEYYLTDIVAIARENELRCVAVTCDEEETLGINSRADLAAAEAVFQARARSEAMANGATLINPETVWFALDTAIGRDVVIEPNVFFGPGVTVESGATIRAFCHLEGCHISNGAMIGPYARLRPGAEIGGDARIGNFVEVKNAVLEEGAKANHLAYIGDGHIGEAANIGAGTIFCNYDGVSKHRTEIGKRAFIGSNSALVAPVAIGDEAVIGSGSVITRNVAAGDLAVARGSQENKAGLGRRLMEMLRRKKARRE